MSHGSRGPPAFFDFLGVAGTSVGVALPLLPFFDAGLGVGFGPDFGVSDPAEPGIAEPVPSAVEGPAEAMLGARCTETRLGRRWVGRLMGPVSFAVN